MPPAAKRGETDCKKEDREEREEIGVWGKGIGREKSGDRRVGKGKGREERRGDKETKKA